MPNKITTKRAKPKRHPSALYAYARALATLRETPDNAATIGLLADLLATWTRRTIAVDPTAAADIYRALLASWQTVRDADGDTPPASTRDDNARLYHIAVCNRLAELFGEEHSEASKGDRDNAAALHKLMSEDLAVMRLRVKDSAAAFGDVVGVSFGEMMNRLREARGAAPVPEVVDLNLWRQSRPRPVRSLIFAEKGGQSDA